MLIFNKRYIFMPQFTETSQTAQFPQAAHDPETTPPTADREVQRQVLLAQAQQAGGYDPLNAPKHTSA